MVWPLLPGDFFHSDGSLGGWPHMDPAFMSRLTGTSSWTPLPTVDRAGLAFGLSVYESGSSSSRSWVPLSAADRASSAFGLSGYELGGSSSVRRDRLPAHVPAGLQGGLQGVVPPVHELPFGPFIDTDYLPTGMRAVLLPFTRCFCKAKP